MELLRRVRRVSLSLGMTLVFLVVCLALARWLLVTGYRLRT